MTPSEYVRRRRITESARDIADTDEPISGIGYRHGFNSKENFTRAFKSEHHILPSEYRTADNSLKLLHREKPEEKDLALVPEIVKLEPSGATYSAGMRRRIMVSLYGISRKTGWNIISEF